MVLGIAGKAMDEPQKNILAPRLAALDWVDAVLHGRAAPGSGPDARLTKTPAQTAEAKRLADAILRHRPNLDALMQPFLQRSPPSSIRRIFYLVLVESQLFGAPEYAVAHNAVELAKQDRYTRGKFAALTNAVSRKLAALPAGALLSRKPQKMPKPLRGPMIAAFGQPSVESFEALHAKTPPIDLCFKPNAAAPPAEGVRFAPNHMRLTEKVQFTNWPGFKDGEFWVQDYAAQAPIRSLGDLNGVRVLDLCAAPGGKTMQLAALGAEVTAVDISEARLKRVAQNLARTKLSAEIITADILEWSPDHQFDLVLLDAPCSATGTIRRHPDLPYLKSTSDIAELITLQRQMAERAAEWVKPNGRFMYVVCSLLPKEGEVQADWIEDNIAGLKPEPLLQFDSEISFPHSHRCRLRPDLRQQDGGMDGFFFACYRRETR